MTPDAQLRAFWALDEGAGTVANDASGNGNAGTVINGALWTIGKVNGGLAFDGVDDYVGVPNRPALNPTGGLTLAAWIKPSQFGQTRMIVSKYSDQNVQYFLRISNTARVRFNLRTGTTLSGPADSITVLAANTWYHVVGTYDGAQAKLYINGVLETSASKSGAMSDNGIAVNLGRQPGGMYFAGALDEAKILGRALTATEVLQEFNRSALDTVPPAVAITAFASGTVISNVTTLSATATDNVAVAGVEFRIDGVSVAPEDTSAPYATLVDTTTLTNGPHTLTAVARDLSGLTTTSAPVSVIVDNVNRRPNVVLIMTDDQRWDTMQFMPLTTAEFASSAVTFMLGFAPAPLCCPNRASLLTGLYPHTHGVVGNGAPNGGATVFNDSSTLARWLSNAGYRTGLYGKYMNDYNLLAPYVPPGWSEWHVFDAQNGGFYNYTLVENGVRVSYGSSAQDYSTDVLTSKVEQLVQGTPPTQPFFVFLSLYAPHEPYTPAAADIGAFSSYLPPRPPSFDEADVSDKPLWVRNLQLHTPSAVAIFDADIRRQLESLQAVDRATQRVMTALRNCGKIDDTLVIFTSDNGLTWGEHRLFMSKDCVYDECTRVPFIIRAPGVQARNDSNLVHTIDLTTTIADWTEVVPPYPLKGASILPLLDSPSAAWRSAFLIESLGHSNSGQNFYAVRTAQYVYAEYLNGERELYDLQLDPYQLTNVVNVPAYATTVQSLQVLLATLKSQ